MGEAKSQLRKVSFLLKQIIATVVKLSQILVLRECKFGELAWRLEVRSVVPLSTVDPSKRKG